MNTQIDQMTPAGSKDLNQIIQEATLCIAPLWNLKNFVAVNPFFGFMKNDFLEAAKIQSIETNASLFMPIEFYRAEFRKGEISKEALSQAAAEVDLTEDELFSIQPKPPSRTVQSLVNLSDLKHRTQASRLVVLEISKLCSMYFDESQSIWNPISQSRSLYSAWKEFAVTDKTLEVNGFLGARELLGSLPNDAEDCIEQVTGELGLTRDGLRPYFHHLLASVRGWASSVRQTMWDTERLKDNHSKRAEMKDLLAILLAYEWLIAKKHPELKLALNMDLKLSEEESLYFDCLMAWLFAYEKTYISKTLSLINAQNVVPRVERPHFQAIFCIDVRSEVMRRALEKQSKDIVTKGFAGFFGFPIASQSLEGVSREQCPVLLPPAFKVREKGLGQSLVESGVQISKKADQNQLASDWNFFKSSATSCFAYVESLGLLQLVSMITDSFGLKKRDPLNKDHRTDFDLDSIALETLVSMAERAIINMSFDTEMARVVLICGHGSCSTNNAYASGLDCGACGGNTGEVNAKVAAQILNRADVRQSLSLRGLKIPTDTLFLAGMHNTTTDEISIYNEHTISASHAVETAELKNLIAQATLTAARERTGLEQPSSEVQKRSQDWSEVRPEWGLAGNAMFVVARRSRTKGVALGGRSFLHDYCYENDLESKVLELIMTAPMVVTNWINMQYYASTVDNAHFGSGNKVTHNIVGGFRIMQGNRSDVMTGLPLQSLHNGTDWVHLPMRLHVLIEAPLEKIEGIIAKHEMVRHLAENGWLHILAMPLLGADQKEYQRFVRLGEWKPDVLAPPQLH